MTTIIWKDKERGILDEATVSKQLLKLLNRVTKLEEAFPTASIPSNSKITTTPFHDPDLAREMLAAMELAVSEIAVGQWYMAELTLRGTIQKCRETLGGV